MKNLRIKKLFKKSMIFILGKSIFKEMIIDHDIFELENMRNNPIGSSLILESPNYQRENMQARSFNS